ncbi:cysteine peptidase family C39 domain-containing protein, partial [Patulibacter defluvii]|uniref:cysteine peptidase family C39 domain-containing protein n=1 Tax=Patulibacter defluvii TaxID=3095358 RepID=UPI002A752DB3
MRRRLVPRVVQTSAMDCGPAALAALLRGHRIAADVATLRARCATDVDGTSIAALADASREHGLPLTQRLLPPEHVGRGPDATLPLIAVVTAPGDVPHFAVLWRARGPLVQVLDPACGRRWMRRRTVVRWLWRHQAMVSRAAWEGWSAGPAMHDPLERRLRRLGVGRRRRQRLLDGPGVAVADLDAAARATAAIARRGRRGRTL